MLWLAMRLDTTLTSTNPRFVIVHYHIFKNGGTTIEAILEREFGQSFATLHNTKASATLNGGHVASFLRRHPQISAISSHHLRYPKPAIRHTIVFDCCFLRHPLERLAAERAVTEKGRMRVARLGMLLGGSLLRQ